MQVKMLEYFQGSDVNVIEVETGNIVQVLVPDGIYEVSPDIGAYLLEHRKAEAMTPEEIAVEVTPKTPRQRRQAKELSTENDS